MSKEIIDQLYNKYEKTISEYRIHLHEHPELSWKEYETQKYIINILEQNNIPYEILADTGVVGHIKGSKPGRTILLRSDMDALPVTELADVSYKSKNEGVMHACGHDGHMSSLLGAALILNELKDQLSGEVKLMFQPAEELGAGARKMISEGVLENPKVDIAFGIHVSPVLPAGHIYTKVGGFFSAPNIFAIKIIGKGSHGALPHLGIDPINISSQFISCAQSLITRQMVATQPVVLSFCKIQGGNSYNVIPDYVDISGTLRTFSEENRKSMKNKVKLLLEGITSAYGATYELKWIDEENEIPAVMNDADAIKFLEQSVNKILPPNHFHLMDEPAMVGEDFGYITKLVPSAFMWVGVHKENTPSYSLHSPHFYYDEKDLLPTSVKLFAQVALDYLS